MKLIKELCEIHSPSGDEYQMKDFILKYINKEKNKWLKVPKIIQGDEMQDCLMLVFGKPRTAIFAHMDSIGFTAKYNNEIIKIGSPVVEEGTQVVGTDKNGKINSKITIREKNGVKSYHLVDREIIPGTSLTFKVNYRENKDFIQSSYLDNRLGVWNALKVAETLENGIICFTCWEEHNGGSVGYLAKNIYENYSVKQALISDITWITNGVKHGKGAAISMRDSAIPRQSFIRKIIKLAEQSKIPFQIEVENSGGSDGNSLQSSSYPFDWCFIGAPEDFVHSPNEKVHKEDIISMLELYKYLMVKL